MEPCCTQSAAPFAPNILDDERLAALCTNDLACHAALDRPPPADVIEQALVDGRLRVLSSEPGLLGYLNDIADDLNARDEITQKVPGELRNALEARYVPRDAPDFLDVLKEYVSKYYGLELRSSADMQEEKADFIDL